MDPNKIKNDTMRPYNAPQEKEEGEKVDPKKFKKVMKVDETEEAQKRKKRNLPKEEEEGEEEGIPSAIPLPVSTPFAEFMSDRETLTSVFDKESQGIQQKLSGDEAENLSPSNLSLPVAEEIDLGQESSLPSREGEEAPPPRPLQESSSQTESRAPEETPYSSLPSSYEQATSTSKQEVSAHREKHSTNPPPPPLEEKQSEQKEKTSLGKKEKDSSLLASQPKKGGGKLSKKKGIEGATLPTQLPSKKKRPDKKTPPQRDKQPFERDLFSLPDAGSNPLDPTEKNKGKARDAAREKTAQAGAATKEDGAIIAQQAIEKKEKMSPLFMRLSPEEIRAKKREKEKKESQLAPSMEPINKTQGKEQHAEKKGQEDLLFVEASNETASIPLPTSPSPILPIEPSVRIAPYAQLTPEIYEIFEKIGGMLTVQEERGIKTTTMTVQMPGSIFDGTKVVLEQFSTAPNAYNIQLVGNPDSVKIFDQNLDALKQSFAQANFDFETHMLSPILTTQKKSPHLIKRGRSKGNKGDGEGEGKK